LQSAWWCKTRPSLGAKGSRQTNNLSPTRSRHPSSSSVLLSSLELSDTRVYEPYIRALLGSRRPNPGRFAGVIDSGLVGSTDFPLGGVPGEQKMLKGHLPRVIHHQVYWYTKIGNPHVCIKNGLSFQKRPSRNLRLGEGCGFWVQGLIVDLEIRLWCLVLGCAGVGCRV